ncbi:hypothetical protein J2X36_000081 [Methylobacterium sp. BE186]|uniref:hypothetical protein n=1 Tax=Methylobacterium sp. BE186 TaxID=2817715 RepID=UPI00286480B5|nr:hypothetical protein [Methylobacterium sp. BE186]MDR7035346.1 hypothetical protein [Methylobacterium sp. BE186]
MSIYVHLAGISAALAAALALAMPGAGGPARAAVRAEPARAAAPAPGGAPLCREAAWPYAVSACPAGAGRIVRVISFAGAPPQPRGGPRP